MTIGEKIDEIVKELELHEPLSEFMACQILKAVCGAEDGKNHLVRIDNEPASTWHARFLQAKLHQSPSK